MKVGVLEICSKNHYVLVEAWAEIAREQGHQVEIATDSATGNLLRKGASVQLVPSGLWARIQFLRRWMRSCDLVILTSLQSRWLLFFLLSFSIPRVRLWITIHNARTWALPTTVTGCKEKGKALIKGWIRKRWMRRCEHMVVNSNNMWQYLQTVNPDLASRCRVVPFRLCERDPVTRTWNGQGAFRIAVPGMLSRNRRNYDVYAKLCEAFGSKIELRFLGAPNPNEGGTALLEDLRKLSARTRSPMMLFEEYLPPESFELLLEESHLVLADVEVTYSRYDYREIYGVSKDSGLSYAMISHQLPGMFQSAFKNLQELASSTLYFQNDEDLLAQIATLISRPERYSALAKAAASNSQAFRVSAVSARLGTL